MLQVIYIQIITDASLCILYEISCITCIIAMYYAMYAMLCTFV